MLHSMILEGFENEKQVREFFGLWPEDKVIAAGIWGEMSRIPYAEAAVVLRLKGVPMLTVRVKQHQMSYGWQQLFYGTTDLTRISEWSQHARRQEAKDFFAMLSDPMIQLALLKDEAKPNGWRRSQHRSFTGKMRTVYHVSPENFDAPQGRYSSKHKAIGIFVATKIKSILGSWAAFTQNKQGGRYKKLTLYEFEIPESLYQRAKARHQKLADLAWERLGINAYGGWGWDEEVFITEDIIPFLRIVGEKTGPPKAFIGDRRPNSKDELALAKTGKLSNLAAREYLRLRDEIGNTRLRGRKIDRSITDKLKELIPLFQGVSDDYMSTFVIAPMSQTAKAEAKAIVRQIEQMLLTPDVETTSFESDIALWDHIACSAEAQGDTATAAKYRRKITSAKIRAMSLRLTRAKSKKNPKGKVIVIGLGTNYRDQLEWAIDRVPDHIVRQIIAGKADEYDMASWPERGDALDHITKDTEAVLAFHLFGIHERDTDVGSLKPDYFYNKRNHQLLAMTRKLGVPLYVFGDQPKGASTLFKAYNVEP